MRQADHYDVIIIGAGISGLGAACHLQAECPNKRFVILEGRDAIGGTWDLFRYPGIRSDSDLYTYGYDFKPWHGQPIATAPEIMRYVDEVVQDHDIERHIRFNHWVTDASWSTPDARWTVRASTDDGEATVTGKFLFICVRATTTIRRAINRTSPTRTRSTGRSSTRSSGRKTLTTATNGWW